MYVQSNQHYKPISWSVYVYYITYQNILLFKCPEGVHDFSYSLKIDPFSGWCTNSSRWNLYIENENNSANRFGAFFYPFYSFLFSFILFLAINYHERYSSGRFYFLWTCGWMEQNAVEQNAYHHAASNLNHQRLLRHSLFILFYGI